MRISYLLFGALAAGTAACTAILGGFHVGETSAAGAGGASGTSSAAQGGAGLGVSPASATIGELHAQQFMAAGPVTWSLKEGAGSGAIDASGKYVAPGNAGVFHVVATSKANPTQTATATVTVKPLGLSVYSGLAGGPGTLDGPASQARFLRPRGMGYLKDLGPNGSILIADELANTIRKSDFAMMGVTTVAGAAGQTGTTDGTGAAARFTHPTDLATDGGSRAFVLDHDNNCIRTVDATSGAVKTLAGQCGKAGHSDGPGSQALFESVDSMVMGPYQSFLYVCEDGQFRGVRRVDAQTGLTISLFSVNGGPCQLAPDDWTNGCRQSKQPCDIYLDYDNGALWKFQEPPNGAQPDQNVPMVVLMGGIPDQGGFGAMALMTGFGNESDLYALSAGAELLRWHLGNGSFDATPFVGSNPDRQILDGVSANGNTPSTARLLDARSLGGVPSYGLVGIGDRGVVRQLNVNQSPASVSTPLGLRPNAAPVDGPAGMARFTGPLALAIDPTGVVYAMDETFGGGNATQNDTLRRVDPMTLAVTTLSGVPGPMNSEPSDGDAKTAHLGFPFGMVALGPSLYFTDFAADAVRRVSIADGSVQSFAGTIGMKGNVDDIGAAARFNFFGGPMDGKGLDVGAGLASDGTDLYVADGGNQSIRKIIVATGEVKTIAGGTTGNGQFLLPCALAYDRGALYVGDARDQTIRKIDLAHNDAVSTLIGLSGQAGDVDGNAATATFDTPFYLAPDGLGNLFVTEFPFAGMAGISSSTIIRRIDLSGPTVSLFAGAPGQQGIAPGPLPASLSCPTGMAFTAGGDLLISDACDGAIAIIKSL